MSEHQVSPLAGVLRVVFFLAVAVIGVTAVVTGVSNLYEKPSGDEVQFEGLEGFEGFEGILFGPDQETADYNRNQGMILGFIGIGIIAVGLLGLGSRFNPLRSGLLGGGAALVMAGVFIGSGGSNEWLTFLTSGLATLTLIACSPWLDDGFPLEKLTGGATSGGAGSGDAPVSDPGGGESRGFG